MTTSKLFFHSNIAFLRQRKLLTQEGLAQILDLARNKLMALESGKTKNPAALDLVKFSEYFKISINILLKEDLRKFSEFDLRRLQENNDPYLKGSQLRVLAITVDKENKENTEYVPIKAKAGYSAGYNDPEFIAKLPKFSLPNLPKSGTFRMFPTTGDSMLPIPEKSDVIAQYVEDWKDLKADTPCIIILKSTQDFVFKLVTIQEDSTVLLKSLNRNYEPYAVEAENILEIWKYVKHQTDIIPEVETDLQEIKQMILSLKRLYN